MAGAPREFPDAPRVGVGAVILDGTRVLLARRGRAPSAGKWSIPGGLVDVGERPGAEFGGVHNFDPCFREGFHPRSQS